MQWRFRNSSTNCRDSSRHNSFSAWLVVISFRFLFPLPFTFSFPFSLWVVKQSKPRFITSVELSHCFWDRSSSCSILLVMIETAEPASPSFLAACPYHHLGPFLFYVYWCCASRSFCCFSSSLLLLCFLSFLSLSSISFFALRCMSSPNFSWMRECDGIKQRRRVWSIETEERVGHVVIWPQRSDESKIQA